ncbi:MAG: hypothetical protein ACFCVE_10805 [Phycisphaerae bacterium]
MTSCLWPLLAWTPFLSPPPLYDVWFLFLIPLLFGVALVYKAVKVGHVSRLAPEALRLGVFMHLAIFGLAAALWIMMLVVEWGRST